MISQLRVEKQELEVNMEALVHQLDLCFQEAASRDSRLDELSEQLQQAQLLLQNVNTMSAENDRLHDEISELNIKLRASAASDASKSERIAELLEENKKIREKMDSSLVAVPSAPPLSILANPVVNVASASKSNSSPNPFYDSPATPVAGSCSVFVLFRFRVWNSLMITRAAAAEPKRDDDALFSNVSVDSHNSSTEEGSICMLNFAHICNSSDSGLQAFLPPQSYFRCFRNSLPQ
jgi:hypothetical protein